MKQLTHEKVKLNKQYKTTAKFIFWLDGVTDTSNIGLIIRLADALAVKKIEIKSNASESTIRKAKKISHVNHSDIEIKIVKEFQNSFSKDYEIIGIEITNKSIPFYKYSFNEKTIFVVGNEKNGISQEVLDACKKTVEIPLLGNISSLNVAQSLSIVSAYAITPYLSHM